MRTQLNILLTCLMNAWKINTLMNKNFPALEAVDQDWVNVQNSDSSAAQRLTDIIKEYITADELLISINRKVGTRLPLNEGIEYIANILGDGRIRISNRDFTQFVLIAQNCVATGCQKQVNQSKHSDGVNAAGS